MKYQVSVSELLRDSLEILESIDRDDAEVVIVRNGEPIAVIVPPRYFPDVVEEVSANRSKRGQS